MPLVTKGMDPDRFFATSILVREFTRRTLGGSTYTKVARVNNTTWIPSWRTEMSYVSYPEVGSIGSTAASREPAANSCCATLLTSSRVGNACPKALSVLVNRHTVIVTNRSHTMMTIPHITHEAKYLGAAHGVRRWYRCHRLVQERVTNKPYARHESVRGSALVASRVRTA